MSAEETAATELDHCSSASGVLYMGCFTHSRARASCGRARPSGRASAGAAPRHAEAFATGQKFDIARAVVPHRPNIPAAQQRRPGTGKHYLPSRSRVFAGENRHDNQRYQ